MVVNQLKARPFQSSGFRWVNLHPYTKGIDVKQFPEGVGHFFPKMPCLECGSPWWVGDDWDAQCANCGGDAESYDNAQLPHAPYKRRFDKFRQLVGELLAKR